MPTATEWLIVLALRVRINSAIMGRQEKISATEQIKMMIPDTWEDEVYKAKRAELEKEFAVRKSQCIMKTGKHDDDKLNDATDQYSDDTFKSIWNLLSRIGKLPQQSQISEDD